jgi:dTDP-4-amino-4,6-dideoxygalactose transaminase
MIQKRRSPVKLRPFFLIHVLGYACDMSKYVNFCQSNNLFLLEDCCESFGAFDKSKHVGSFGKGGTFSHFFFSSLNYYGGRNYHIKFTRII